MDSKQLAVDWLVEKIKLAKPDFKFDALIREAKEMEKEQIVKSIIETIVGSNEIYDKEYPEVRKVAEFYYTSTYGK